MGFGSDRAEQNLKSSVSSCKNFKPNIFNKTKCQNCFRTREAHQLDNDGDNQRSKKVIICGYLFVAPGLDVNNPSSRTRKWQRRCFIFYESGDLNYALDENPSTIPQGTVNMYECTDVFKADAEKTGHDYSMGIVTPDSTTYIRAEMKEERDRWFSVLAEYPQINRAAAKSKSKKRETKAPTPAAPAPTPAQEHPQVIPDRIRRHDDLPKKIGAPQSSKSRDRRPLSVDRFSGYTEYGYQPKNIYDNERQSRSRGRRSESDINKDKNKNYESNKDVHITRPRRTTSEHARARKSSDSSITSTSSTESKGGTGVNDGKPEQPHYHGPRKQYKSIADVPTAKLTEYQSQQPNAPNRRASTGKAGMTRELAESHELFPTLKEQFENPDTLKSGSSDKLRHQRGEPYASKWYPSKDYMPAEYFAGMDNWVWNEYTKRWEDNGNGNLPADIASIRKLESIGSDEHAPRRKYSDTKAAGDGNYESKEEERKRPGLRGTYDDLAPSRCSIEKKRRQQARRTRHTLGAGAITASKDLLDEVKGNDNLEEHPEPRKRSNSDPVMEDLEKLKAKSIFPGFGDIIHLKKGWLIKQENQKDWSKYWFVLSDNTLKYYQDSKAEEAETEEGCINLSTCKDVMEKNVDRNYGFHIETIDNDIIVLAAMTNGIRNNWIQAIRKAVAALPPPQEPSSSPVNNKDIEDIDSPDPHSREKEEISRKESEEEKPFHVGSEPKFCSKEVKENFEGKVSPVPSRKFLPDVDYMLGNKPTSDVTHSTPAKKLAGGGGQKYRGSPIKFESNPVYLTRLEAIRSPSSNRISPTDHSSRALSPNLDKSSDTRKDERQRFPQTRVSMETESAEDEDEDEDSETDEEEESGDSAHEREADTMEIIEPKVETVQEKFPSPEKVVLDTSGKDSEAHSNRTSVSESSESEFETETLPVHKSTEKTLDLLRHTSNDNTGNITSSSGEAVLVDLLEAEVESLKAQLEKTQQDLVEAHQQNIELKTQMTTVRRDHRESISEIEDDQNKYLVQIEDMNTQQDHITQRNHRLQSELKESKTYTEITKQQLQQLKNKLSNANDTIFRQENEIEQLKTKLEIAVSELSESDTTLQKLRGDLRTEKDKSENALDLFSEKNEKLECQILELKTMLSRAEAEVHAKSKHIKDLERSNQRQDALLKIEHLSLKLEESKQRLKESEEDIVSNEERFEKRYSRLQGKYQTERQMLELKLTKADEKVAFLMEEKASKEQTARRESEKLDEEWQEQEDKIEELLHQLKTEMTEKSKLQEQLDEAEGKLTELTQTLQGDKSDAATSVLRIQGLEDQLNESERRLKEALDTIQRREDANIHLQEELKQTKAKVNELQKMNDALKEIADDHNSNKKRIDKLSEDLDKAVADKLVAEEYLDSSSSEIQHLQRILQDKTDEVEQLRGQLQDGASDHNVMSTQSKSSIDEVSDLKAQLEQSLNDLENLQEQLKDSQGQIKKLKIELENKTIELDDVSARLREKQDESSQLKSDLEKCQSHRASVQQQILQQTVEISQLRKQLQDAQSAIEKEDGQSDGKQETEKHKETVEALQTQIKSLKEQHQEEMTNKMMELQELKNSLEKRDKKVADAERCLAEERHSVMESLSEGDSQDTDSKSRDDIDSENKHLKARYESAVQELKRLRNELKTANSSYDELEFQYLQSKEDNRRAQKNFDEEMDLMSNRIRDLTSKLAASDRKLRDSEKKVTSLERKMGGNTPSSSAKIASRELESKLEELEMKLYDVEGTLKAQEEETDSLKGKIGFVEQKVASRAEPVQSSSVEPLVSVSREMKAQTVPVISLTSSSSPQVSDKTSEKKQCSSSSNGGESDDSDSSVPREKLENPKQKRLLRMKSLETKLLTTEQKLKEVTAKLVDVTTKELSNRKAYHTKCVSENRLKEQVKDFKAKMETLSKELENEHSIRVRIVNEVSSQLSELELKLDGMESTIEDAKLKIADLLQELQRHRVSHGQNSADYCSLALGEVEKHMLETRDTLSRAEKALGLQESEILEKENPEMLRRRLVGRKSSAESQSSETSFGRSDTSLKSMDDDVSTTIDLLREQLSQADERLQEKETELVAQESITKEQRIGCFAEKLAFEAVTLGKVSYVLQQSKQNHSDKKGNQLSLEVLKDNDQRDDVPLSCPVEHFAETLSTRIVMQGSLGATLSRTKAQEQSLQDNIDDSDVDGDISNSRRNLSPRRAISEPLLRSVHDEDGQPSHVGEFASSLAEQALKEGEMMYVIETKVKDLQQQLQKAYKRMEHQQVRLKKLMALCEEGKVDEMKKYASEGLTQESAMAYEGYQLLFPQVENIQAMSATEMTDPNQNESSRISDSQLASLAKQIELEETHRFANEYASGEIVRAEMLRILQRVMNMYEREINMERASCMQMLKVQRQAAEKKYADIEASIREEMSGVLEEIKDRYETELDRLKQEGREEQDSAEGPGPLYNEELMKQFADIVARRAVLSSHLTYWGDTAHSLRSRVKPQHRRHSLSALTQYTGGGDGMVLQSEHLLAKCSSMNDFAEMLAQRAIFQAELTYIMNKLQVEQKQQLDALQEAYEKVCNGKVIESITMEHAMNLTSVRERYEVIIKNEREEQVREMNKFQDELDKTKSELGEVLQKMNEKEQYVKKTPEIQFTLEDDLNEQVEEMTSRRVKHLTDELDIVKEQLNSAEETLRIKTEEHIKEVDSITDVMESVKEKHNKQMEDVKDSHRLEIDKFHNEHDELIAKLRGEIQIELKEMEMKYEEELGKVVENYEAKLKDMCESMSTNQDQEIAQLKEKCEEEVKQVKEQYDQKFSDAASEIADLQHEEICELKQNYQHEIDDIKGQSEQKLKDFTTQMLDLKEQHESEIKEYQEKQEDLKIEQERVTMEMKQQYEGDIQRVKDEYEQKLKQLNTEMLDLKEVHESEIKELQDKWREDEAVREQAQAQKQNDIGHYEEEIRKLKDEYEQKLTDVTTEMLDMKELHESEIKELQEKHEEEIAKVEKEYEDKLKDIEDDMTHLEDDLQKETAELKVKYEDEISRIKRDYEDRLSESHSEPASPQLKSPSEQKLANVRREYEQRLSKVKVEHEKKMSYMQESYEDDIGKIRREQEKKTKQIEQKHEGQIAKLRQEQERYEHELEERYRHDFERLSHEQQYKISELEQKYEEAIDSMKSDHSREMSLIDEEHGREMEDMKNEYEEKLDNFAELHETDLQAVKMSQMNNVASESPLVAESVPLQQSELPQQSLVASLREKYEKEIELLRKGSDIGLVRAQRAHKVAIDKLKKRHFEEISRIRQDRERNLGDESAATLSAMKALKKKHEEELERERARYHLHGNVNESIEALKRDHQEELEKIETEMVALSQQYSVKCIENSALEEQLATLQRCLEEKKQSIYHLTTENTDLNDSMADEIANLRSTLGVDGEAANSGAMASGAEILELYEVKVNLRVKESEVQVMQEEIAKLRQNLDQTKQEENEMFAEKYKKLKMEHDGTEEKVKYLEMKLNETYEKLKEAEAKRSRPRSYVTKTKQPSKSNLDRERSYSESNLSSEIPGTTKWYSEENLRKPSPDIRLGTFIPMDTKKSKVKSIKPTSSTTPTSSKSTIRKTPSTDRGTKKLSHKSTDSPAASKKKDPKDKSKK